MPTAIARKPRTRKPAATPVVDSTLARAFARLETSIKPTIAPKVEPTHYVISAAEIIAAATPVVETKPVPTVAPSVRDKVAPTTLDGNALATEFDITRDNGAIVAISHKTGNVRRFLISAPSAGSLAGKRIVHVAETDATGESRWVGFAFADSYGVRPWGVFSKCPIPMETRAAYARFLENLKRHEANGTRLVIVRD